MSCFNISHYFQVQCLLCPQELAYNNNTSSMLRHFRAKHENVATPQANVTNPGSAGVPSNGN